MVSSALSLAETGAVPRSASVCSTCADGGAGLGLLDLLRDDLMRHSGAPLEDDAALLLVRATVR